MTLSPSLRIVVIAPESLATDGADEHEVQEAERSRLLRIALLENGYNVVAVLPTDTFLGERIAQLEPDMIVVDAESAARDALEHVVMATRDHRRPIVMFTNDGDTRSVPASNTESLGSSHSGGSSASNAGGRIITLTSCARA